MLRFHSILAGSILACVQLPSPVSQWTEMRTPDVIIKAIDELVEPSLPESKKDDPEAIRAYREQLDEARGRVANLTGELFRADPENSRLITLLPRRWDSLAKRGPSALQQVVAETEQVIAVIKNGTLREHAAVWMLHIALQRNPGPAEVEHLVDRYFAIAPNAEHTADRLMSFVTSLDRDDRVESERVVLQRVVARFPESQAAKRAVGILRRLDGIGKPFELEFADAVGGSKVSMRDLRGKVVVLDFWATWCGPCLNELPRMKELYAKYKDKGTEFIGVSLDHHGQLDRLKSFLKEKEIPWPQYYQGNSWRSEFLSSWGIHSIPAVFVVDRNGVLVSVNAHGKLETLIPALLNPPVTSPTP